MRMFSVIFGKTRGERVLNAIVLIAIVAMLCSMAFTGGATTATRGANAPTSFAKPLKRNPSL